MRLFFTYNQSKMTEELECTEKIPKDAVNQKPSKGVEQIEALSASMSNWTRAWIFASIFLLAYAYRLDSLVRRTVSVLKQSDKPCLMNNDASMKRLLLLPIRNIHFLLPSTFCAVLWLRLRNLLWQN